MREFAIDKNKSQGSPGFVPTVTNAIGYGLETAKDPHTGNTGLVPIEPFLVDEHGRSSDNPHCYAKALQYDNDDQWVYYLRTNAMGEVSDPWGLFADSAQNARVSKHRGISEWSFTRVTEDQFTVYLRYLCSRNRALLRICERSIKDA
jgi:hypothetical protein